MGLTEAFLTIAKEQKLSWNDLSWFNGAVENEANMCKFVNADTPNGTELVHPSDGKGADWRTLWVKYGSGPFSEDDIPTEIEVQAFLN